MPKIENREYTALVKDQYLPPPLQAKCISAFDIQIKAIKKHLDGTDDQKINIIKRRIKKFFDYGSGDSEAQVIGEQLLKKKKSAKNYKNKLYPKFEPSERISENLEIDTSKLIIYGDKVSRYEVVQKYFKGFRGYEKIDDSNVKLCFYNHAECKKILINALLDKSICNQNEIEYPKEIKWFEIETVQNIKAVEDSHFLGEKSSLTVEENQQRSKIYARFWTNKDDISFKNDKYFRKLLAKARAKFESNEMAHQRREKQAREKRVKQNIHKTRKIFKNQKYHPFKKPGKQMINEDYQTEYLEESGAVRRSIDSIESRVSSKNSRKRSHSINSIQNQRFKASVFGQKNPNPRGNVTFKPKNRSQIELIRSQSQEKNYFDNLNISKIEPPQIQLQSQKNNLRQNQNRFSSRCKPFKQLSSQKEPIIQESLYFDSKASLQPTKNINELPLLSSREILIKKYRDRAYSYKQEPRRKLKDYSFTRDIGKNIDDKKTANNNPNEY